MTQQFFSIPSENGHLSGVLHLPNVQYTSNFPLIILLHGFVGSKVGEHRLFVKAARHFTEQGYAVFRFDFGGCGESDGDYSQVTVSKQLNEVQTVLDFVSQLEQIDAKNIFLIGHSLGGAIASLTAAKDTRIKQLVLWSPVAKPFEDITGITGKHAVTIAKENGLYDYHGFYLSHEFFNDLKKHQPLDAIQNYRHSALIIHAEADEDIPKEHTHRYAEALKHRRVKNSVDTYFINKADHTFSGYNFEHELFTVTTDWLEKLVEKAKKIA